MVEMDLEDFIEEVKFQMTEYDILEKDIIMDWEARARKWTATHVDKKRIIKMGQDITLVVKNEEIMEEIALKYYQAVKQDKVKDYWYRFKLLA